MKKFRIKVNGNEYEVEVEEIGGEGVPAASVSVPKASQPATAQPAAPAVPQQTVPQQTKETIPTGAHVVTAPMPGKVMSIKIQVGQKVKADDIAIILEAMKMENEIFCGVEGTIKEIKVNEGAAVNPGDALVVIA